MTSQAADSDNVYVLPPVMKEGPALTRSQLSESIGWGQRAHGLEEVWDRTRGGEGIRVGVIDTGWCDHPDLPEPVVRFNGTTDSNDVDYNGHGCHVAGIVGARANGVGVHGVAPRSELASFKGLNNAGFGRERWLEACINSAVEADCHIVNCSFGGGFSARLEAAIERAVRRGVIFVCAIGNGGHGGTIHPGNSRWTAGTGSYNEAGNVSRFSARGADVDVACPGENIVSTWLDGGYQALSGTSMATPFLAGLLALALGEGVEITAQNVRTWLRETVVDRGEPGHDRDWGWGTPDVDKMIPAREAEEVFITRDGKFRVTYSEPVGLTIQQVPTELAG